MDKLISNRRPCSLFEKFSLYRLADVEIPVPADLQQEIDLALRELAEYLKCDLDLVYDVVAKVADMTQRQMQYQAWLGLFSWETYHNVIYEVMPAVGMGTRIMEELKLICDFNDITLVQTDLINTTANFNFAAIPWAERVKQNYKASIRNHIIKYGLEKYYYDHKGMLIEWDRISQKFLSHILKYVPVNIKYLGSSWFK